MSGASPSNYVWWLAGRSAGIVALLLITASVLLGLAMAARLLPPKRRKGAMRLHQHLALVGLGAIAAHGLLLAADPWLKAGLSGVAVPFAIAYRPLWTGLGVIGGYLAAILGLSFYLRRQIGARTWRQLHRLTILAYALSLAHALGSGTDTSIPPVRDAVLASAVPVVGLLALRTARGRTRQSRSRGRPGSPTQGPARSPRQLDPSPSRAR